jgi:chromosomal replication initiation ATPase DnaA
MGAIELRNQIIELLNTDNISYLEEVFEFALNKIQSVDSFDKLPIPIQELLQESLQQADRGEVIPHDQVMEEVRKRYNITK